MRDDWLDGKIFMADSIFYIFYRIRMGMGHFGQHDRIELAVVESD